MDHATRITPSIAAPGTRHHRVQIASPAAHEASRSPVITASAG
jgi:hypothetical protein